MMIHLPKEGDLMMIYRQKEGDLMVIPLVEDDIIIKILRRDNDITTPRLRENDIETIPRKEDDIMMIQIMIELVVNEDIRPQNTKGMFCFYLFLCYGNLSLVSFSVID